jgi:hypothetical protein
MASNCWDTLGIAATDDVRAIKSAYAVKLKAFDPDTDPNYFLKLRSARATALATAQQQPLPPEAEVGFQSTFSYQAAPEASQTAPEIRNVSRPESAESLLNQSVRLLWDQGQWTVGLDQKLYRLVRQLLDSGDLDNLDSSKKFEALLAQLIVETVPRSDCLIEPVSAYFGWAETAKAGESLDQAVPEFVPDVLQRMADLSFRQEMEDPSHHLNRALALLRKPCSSPVQSEEAAQYGAEVGALLNTIHLYYPSLKRELNEDHYQIWMNFFDPQFVADDGLIEFAYHDPKAEYLAGLKGCFKEIGVVFGFFIFIVIVVVITALLNTNE